MGMSDDYELDYDYSMDDDDLRGIDPADMFYMAQQSSDLVKKETAKNKKPIRQKRRKNLRKMLLKSINVQ